MRAEVVQPPATDPRAVGLACAVASAVCFGGAGPFAKPLMDAGLGALDVVWLRLAGGALLMLPLAVRSLPALRRKPKLVLGYGLLAVAGVQTCYFAAITSVPVAVALLIEFLGPVLLLGWVRFVRRERVSRSAVVGVTLAVLGLALVVEIWVGLRFDPLGLLLALGAAGCQMAYFLLADSRDGSEVGAGTLAAGGMVVGAVAVTLLARPWTVDWSILGRDVVLAGRHVPALLPVVWLGLVSAVLAYLTGVIAIRRLSPPVAGAVAYLEPVVATVLAWLLLAEHLGAFQLLGGALVLFGAYLAQRTVPAGPPSSQDTRSVGR